MRIRKLANLIAAAVGLIISAGFASPVFAATYYSTGSITSTDLLSGYSAAALNDFYYNLSSLPGNASVKIQFSKDNANWFAADGTPGGWTSLTTVGGAQISLAAFVSAAGWTSGSGFYYQLQLNATGDGFYSPVMAGIRLDFTPSSDSEKRFVIDNSGRLGIGTTAPQYALDIATALNNDRGINILNSASAGTNYGVYSGATGSANVNYGGYFQALGAASNYGLAVGPMTGAVSTGLNIGALSGAAGNYGINISDISGGAAGNYGINLGTLTGGTGSSGFNQYRRGRRDQFRHLGRH